MILIFEIADLVLLLFSLLTLCNATNIKSPSLHNLEHPSLNADHPGSSVFTQQARHNHLDSSSQQDHETRPSQIELPNTPNTHRGKSIIGSSASNSQEERQPFVWYNVVKDSQGHQKYTLASPDEAVTPSARTIVSSMQPDPFHSLEPAASSHSTGQFFNRHSSSAFNPESSLNGVDYMSDTALRLSDDHAMGNLPLPDHHSVLPYRHHLSGTMMVSATSVPTSHIHSSLSYPSVSSSDDNHLTDYIESQGDLSHGTFSHSDQAAKNPSPKGRRIKEADDVPLSKKRRPPTTKRKSRAQIGPAKKRGVTPKGTDDPTLWRFQLTEPQITRVYTIYMRMTGSRFDTAHKRLKKRCTTSLALDLLSEDYERQKRAINYIGVPRFRSGGPREFFLGKDKQAITAKVCKSLALNAKLVNVMLSRKLDARLGELLKHDDSFQEGIEELKRRPYSYYKNNGMMNMSGSEHSQSHSSLLHQAAKADQQEGNEIETLSSDDDEKEDSDTQ